MIAAICPSRGRPRNIARLVESWKLTQATCPIYICVDDDDPELDAYRALDLPDSWELVVGAPKRFAAWLNEIGPELAETFDVIGAIGDDNVFRTMHWDRHVVEAMQPLGVVYGNDLYQRESLATAPWVDAAIVRHLGWMAPPGIEHLFVDRAWMAIGLHFNTLTYLPFVVIEHAHPFARKAGLDDVYLLANAPEQYQRDRAVFEDWEANRMAVDLEGLA